MLNLLSNKTNEACLQAMGKLGANVIIADKDNVIVYANDSVMEMLKGAESRLRREQPHFSADKLVGSSLDMFYRAQPQYERQNSAYKTTVAIGNLIFELRATPLFGKGDKKFGTALELKDVTDLVRQREEIKNYENLSQSINKSQAVIEFMMDGTILTANPNFLSAMGYTLEEIKGKHHSMFVDPIYRNSVEYQQFWLDLNRGQFQAAEYRRLAKGGKEIWIQASYNPVMDTATGKPLKVIKYATDITEQKVKSVYAAGQIEAISKSQAVIEFKLDGTILHANPNFLAAMGYTLDEIKGKHHSMFADPAYRSSVEYQQFWESLGRGQYQAGEYKRIAKGGREVWIQASYNPIMDLGGKPHKVVKYATDITEQKVKSAYAGGQIEAIGKSQAVIEFNMDGSIVNANSNFLAVMGYTLEEIKGKHHSMFADPAYKNSAEYQQFWANLNRGEYQADEYKRLAKGGREVWIQASYNPILDMNGKPFRVVKYATDITKQKLAIAKINELISAATQGNLKERIDTSEFTGFYGEMTRSMNGLVEAIDKPVSEAVSVLEHLAGGNLMHRMEGNYEGAFATMRQSLDTTINCLADMVKKIAESAQSINVAASEIASGSADLSSRTEQQASSLEETAASMEEITGTVKQNSQNAGNANDLSTNASQVADAGGKVVEEAVSAMSSIEKSSQKISDIIGVIDEIAFQTNLLALNAAVEAARAGDAGKGFAVVASEVRSLAGRSATASKEIKTLINESAAQVRSGAQLVNQAGETLKGIVGSVKQVANIISEIASASVQQSTGIDEINTSVTQMDEMTQQNAALVEQNTAAAQSMLEQSKSLEKLMGFFKLSEEQAQQAAIEETPKVVSMTAAKPLAKKPVASAAKPRPSGSAKLNGSVRKVAVAASAGSKNSLSDGWEEF